MSTRRRNIRPDVARARAKVAGYHGRPADDVDRTTARRELAEANIAAYVDKILADAPPLTADQRTRLAELLRPVRQGAA